MGFLQLRWLGKWLRGQQNPLPGKPDTDSLGLSAKSRKIFAPQANVCGISDIGKIPEHNEDVFYCSSNGRLMIVADGIGGEAVGELASSLSVETARRVFESNKFTIEDDPESAVAQLVAAMSAAQERVIQTSLTRADWQGMGSTLIIAHVLGDELYTAHVGDVRCYVHGTAGLKQITRDHSLVADLIRTEQISPDEARCHPQKGIINRAIGMNKALDPEIHQTRLMGRDRVLLCSDGLWESVCDEEIERVLASDGSARQLATVLVDRANANGGPDNITVVVYEHPSGTQPF